MALPLTVEILQEPSAGRFSLFSGKVNFPLTVEWEKSFMVRRERRTLPLVVLTEIVLPSEERASTAPLTVLILKLSFEMTDESEIFPLVVEH